MGVAASMEYRSRRDHIFEWLCFSFLALGIGILLTTLGFLFRESGAFQNLIERLVLCFTGGWKPLATPPELGLAHAWASTSMVTGIALAISLPMGYGIGIFLAELAPPFLRNLVTPALELLAGVPAVVFGFLGAMTIVPWSERLLDLPTGETLLGAGIVLAAMMLPFVASTSGETFRAIGAEYREAVLSLGVDRFHMFRRVVARKAVPGLMAAASLGIARGLGETLAVLMLSGNTSAPPESPLSRGQPLTALLATELGETAAHTDKYRMLFTGALALMLVVLALNIFVSFLRKRLQRNLHVP